MFRNNVHIVSFPGRQEDGAKNRLTLLVDRFRDHADRLQDSLVLFQSAETPGDIERYFIAPLQEKGINCSYATIFRTDWSLEELFRADRRLTISAMDDEALEKTRIFLNLFGVARASLNSIREAEIYESARKALKFTITSFINQLAMAYPDTDVRALTRTLLQQESLVDNVYPTIGPIGYKTVIAVNQLIDGSSHPERLGLIRNAEFDNLSSILHYAEVIKRRGVNTVTILGISEKGDQKDIRLSPSLILAERLVGLGIEIRLHDPYFSREEVNELMPKARYFDIRAEADGGCECLVVMTDHRDYRYLTQPDIDTLCASARLIIDNLELWKDFSFPLQSIYHVPGDGKLMELDR